MICRIATTAVAVLFVALSAVARTEMERRLGNAGYVDIGEEIEGVYVDLMYARADNFTQAVLYDSLRHAYLHPHAAEALRRAVALLDREAPGVRLLVKDAARPVSVQRRMFDKVRGTPMARYVANPATGGGTHNFGIAVDITLCDSIGRELPMGTAVDHLGPESNIDREEQLVGKGAITPLELGRRRLLRRVMKAAGFKTIRKEWWHFELYRRQEAAGRYPLIDM